MFCILSKYSIKQYTARKITFRVVIAILFLKHNMLPDLNCSKLNPTWCHGRPNQNFKIIPSQRLIMMVQYTSFYKFDLMVRKMIIQMFYIDRVTVLESVFSFLQTTKIKYTRGKKLRNGRVTQQMYLIYKKKRTFKEFTIIIVID